MHIGLLGAINICGEKMAKKVSRKELLKSPDEFITLSERIVNFAKENQRLLQLCGLVIAAVFVLYLAVNGYFSHINNKGQHLYNQAYNALSQEFDPGAESKSLENAEKFFTRVIDEYGMSKAARLALPQLAYIKFRNGKYDEAIGLYKKFMKKASGHREYEAMTSIAIAACYESKNDIDEAIGVIEGVSSDQEGPFREIAMFNLSRLYRLGNSPEKEKEALKQFIEEFSGSPFAQMAKARL